MKCPRCPSEIPDALETCPTCRYNAGTPNVRAAKRQEETEALEERYQRGLELARSNGCEPMLLKFEAAVAQASTVLNVKIDTLFTFLRSSVGLYVNYETGVREGMRKPASLSNDSARFGVSGTLFGAYGDKIMYAALSLDGTGLHSYGPYAVKLMNVAVDSRATVLENNSYVFRRKHGIAPGDQPPPGYTATWDNKAKLAVAKIAEYISPTTTEADFPRLLLSSTGDRETDEFMEVQIYDTFDLYAVESVKGQSTVRSRDESDLLRMVKECLKNLGKEWIEE
jgi:hypothetical protein